MTRCNSAIEFTDPPNQQGKQPRWLYRCMKEDGHEGWHVMDPDNGNYAWTTDETGELVTAPSDEHG
jgi:hypothetical protein